MGLGTGSRELGIGTIALTLAAVVLDGTANAQFVPGSGRKVRNVGDDFEDENWSYVFRLPKSSREDDNRVRSPLGYSKNRRWKESAKRGQPDVIKRVETPSGGLPGSKGALLLQSRDTGIPKRPRGKMAQDDFVCNGSSTSVAASPSFVVRVYLPPFEEWEDRTGSSFGFRVGARTTVTETEEKRGLFGLSFLDIDKEEPYWPGMFIQFVSSSEGKTERDFAVIVVRGGNSGRDFNGPRIMQPGWWTMGMSFSPDGAVHYYASPGVDNLTAQDRIASSFPYTYRAEKVTTMFFNICSADNGRDWSTGWIIDDPSMYTMGGGGSLAELPGMQRDDRGNNRRRGRGFLGGLFR